MLNAGWHCRRHRFAQRRRTTTAVAFSQLTGLRYESVAESPCASTNGGRCRSGRCCPSHGRRAGSCPLAPTVMTALPSWATSSPVGSRALPRGRGFRCRLRAHRCRPGCRFLASTAPGALWRLSAVRRRGRDQGFDQGGTGCRAGYFKLPPLLGMVTWFGIDAQPRHAVPCEAPSCPRRPVAYSYSGRIPSGTSMDGIGISSDHRGRAG